MVFEEVLEEVRVRLTEKIQRQLSGMQGFVLKPIYNSRMPLHVEIATGKEAFELVFLVDGEIELTHGAGSNPDVRIESNAETLMNLFKNPSSELFRELESRNMIKINVLTQKGRDTEIYVRHYLGG